MIRYEVIVGGCLVYKLSMSTTRRNISYGSYRDMTFLGGDLFDKYAKADG